jgi:ABC-type lipoprotein release transport system permease subunit
MAWRNLWRKPVRTGITLAMIFFAVILSTVMSSMQQGVWQRMVDGVVGLKTGYIQVQTANYPDESVLDEGFLSGDSLRQVLNSINGVESTAGRLENFLLAAAGERSRGVLAMSLDHADEKLATRLQELMQDGGSLPGQDIDPVKAGCVVGAGLADYLELKPGDTLVMLGQGYHGAMAAGQAVIRGIVDLGNPDLDSRVVYLGLASSQFLYDGNQPDGDLLTGLVIQPKNTYELEKLSGQIQSQLGTEWSVRTWMQMNPELHQQKEADTAGGILMLFILYLLIAFGILGTILMMTRERRYEFGVLIALGMRRLRLATVVIMESMMLAVVGALLGLAGALPIVRYFAANPIRLQGDLAETYEQYGFEPVYAFSTDPSLFTSQALAIGLIALLVSLYPLFYLRRLRPVEAMRS